MLYCESFKGDHVFFEIKWLLNESHDKGFRFYPGHCRSLNRAGTGSSLSFHLVLAVWRTKRCGIKVGAERLLGHCGNVEAFQATQAGSVDSGGCEGGGQVGEICAEDRGNMIC